MTRPRSARRRPTRRPPVPTDLGPVAFKIVVDARPRIEPPRAEPETAFEGGGLLAALPTVHGRGWTGGWSVAIGSETLKLPFGEGLAASEEIGRAHV